jgi:hypothetical protein
MVNRIDYVDARDGGLEFYKHVNGKSQFVGFAKTPEKAAELFNQHGVGDMYGGSSIDFATEAGFNTDDGAELMLKRAFELI